MKVYQVTMTISESGKLMKLISLTGRLIAEILVEGPLNVCAYNAIHNIPIEKGRANVFRGDLVSLEKDEFLDVDAEKIVSRDLQNK